MSSQKLLNPNSNKDLEVVKFNLLRAMVYASRKELPTEIRHNQAQKTYFELQRIESANGIEEKLVEVDYPITADYVKSFEASANYKNDLETAFNTPAKSGNLGDITSMQDIARMDTEAIKDMYNKLGQVLNSQQSQQAQQAQQTQQNQAKEGE